MTFYALKNALVLALCVLGLNFILVYKSTLLLVSGSLWIIKAYILLTGLFLLSRFFIIIFYDDSHRRKFKNSDYPSVSFVIAAKNEEESIYKTIAECLNSDYPAPIECIVVDDGSDDQTKAEMLRARDELGTSHPVTVISFAKNRGKREAMAEGVLVATGEVIVFVDSDSFVAKDGIKHLVEHFLSDPKVAAVAGNTGIVNEQTNMLTRMQSARYSISFDIFKACESVFGAVTCCPGCFSAYRRDALMTVLDDWRNQTMLGTRSTFGDDRSLTNFILRKWKVVYCNQAKARTIVPAKYHQFMNQQLRWKKSWIREGLMAATFIWRKNFIAAFSFYTNLLLPILSPLVVFYTLLVVPFFFHQVPNVFIAGVVSLSLLYGLFNYWQTQNRYWFYAVPFSIFYMVVLVWQMPYAVYKLRDTKWGTR